MQACLPTKVARNALARRHAARLQTPRSVATVAEPMTASKKVELLELLPGINRGALATPAQRAQIAVALKQLEDAAKQQLESMDSAAVEGALSGKWQLIYTTVEPFRSSPFFWAYQSALGNLDIANQIFKFTDSIPGAEVGQAYQTFDFVSGQLISEVDLEVFPGVRGCVVTTSSYKIGGSPTRLSVTVENTRVAGSNLLPQLFDVVTVPVKDLVERLKGTGATTVEAELTFIDSTLRVTRTIDDGNVFVYRRVTEM